MKKIILISVMLMPFLIIIASQLVSAHCPLCTGAAVAGVGAARFLGVDDSIVGLFLGAFVISTALWFNKWLVKKGIKIRFQEVVLVLVSFVLLVIPLYTTNIITNFSAVRIMPETYSMLGLGIYGIDKLLFGLIIGCVTVWSAFSFSDYIKKKRGKVLWPFQGLSFMFVVLAVLSLIFWLITK